MDQREAPVLAQATTEEEHPQREDPERDQPLKDQVTGILVKPEGPEIQGQTVGPLQAQT